MKASVIIIVGISIGFIGIARVMAEDQPKAPSTGTPEQVFAPGKQMFQPIAVDPALVRQSMQARSEYEDLNRKILARQSKLCEENPTVKELQAKMRELQKQIDKILESDEELNRLKEKFKSISPDIPSTPKKIAPPAAPASTPEKK